MNRVDRLFAMLLLLQRKRRVRAQDLAQALEVSERTIYRDMEALSESGVPLRGTPGEGYELMEGYFVPPLLFTPQEANALFLGAKMLAAYTTGALPQHAEHALAKIAVVLPGEQRGEAERLTQIIDFIAPKGRFDMNEPRLATMQLAIRERLVAHIRYHSYSQDETTEREVEPHGLYYFNGAWYVRGYCRLRQEMRDFRLGRIETIHLTEDAFELREIPVSAPAGTWITARVRFDGNVVRWVHERQHYGFREERAVPGGDDVVMTYEVSGVVELVPWLLQWGAAAVPLEPAELRDAIRREAGRILQRLADPPSAA
jgi:predicted DNA-binding transcriptional regulator YafY